MSGTDGDGYQSAWRADHARDRPNGDPWAAPMSRSTAPDPALPARAADAIATPGDETAAVASPDLSTSDHPTAPWPFVTSRAAFPDAEFSPADELPIAAEFPDFVERADSAERADSVEDPDVAELPDAADAKSPPWPGDLGDPTPPAVWPPTDPPHESAPGVWTPPPSALGTSAGGYAMPPTVAQQAPPAWPQRSAPPSWPPLPDTSAGEGAASISERRAPSSDVRVSAAESASAVSSPPGWAYATEVAAPGVFVREAPAPVWPQSTASGTPGSWAGRRLRWPRHRAVTAPGRDRPYRRHRRGGVQCGGRCYRNPVAQPRGG